MNPAETDIPGAVRYRVFKGVGGGHGGNESCARTGVCIVLNYGYPGVSFSQRNQAVDGDLAHRAARIGNRQRHRDRVAVPTSGADIPTVRDGFSKFGGFGVDLYLLGFKDIGINIRAETEPRSHRKRGFPGKACVDIEPHGKCSQGGNFAVVRAVGVVVTSVVASNNPHIGCLKRHSSAEGIPAFKPVPQGVARTAETYRGGEIYRLLPARHRLRRPERGDFDGSVVELCGKRFRLGDDIKPGALVVFAVGIVRRDEPESDNGALSGNVDIVVLHRDCKQSRGGRERNDAVPGRISVRCQLVAIIVFEPARSGRHSAYVIAHAPCPARRGVVADGRLGVSADRHRPLHNIERQRYRAKLGFDLPVGSVGNKFYGSFVRTYILRLLTALESYFGIDIVRSQ